MTTKTNNINEALEIIKRMMDYTDSSEIHGDLCSIVELLAPNNEKSIHKDFEDYLMNEFGKEYGGLDDEMPDAFDEWLCDLQPDDFISYGNKYGKELTK